MAIVPLVGPWDDLEERVAAEVEELIELGLRPDFPVERGPELQATIEGLLRDGSLSRMAMALSDGLWRPYAHAVLLNIYLTRLMRREITRLLVTEPPQHGKSVTCSKHFPAAYLHRFPDHRIILTSCEADFAATWGGEVRGLIDEHPEILGLEVKQTSRAKKRWDLVGHAGGMMTAGMGGRVVGSGANAFVLDDPVKNDVDAASVVIQDRNWAFWEKVAYSRLRHDELLDRPDDLRAINGKPIVIGIQTRWHEADWAGKILSEEKSVEDGGVWTVLNLPALAEDGDPLGRARDEALCPELHPQAELEQTRATRSASAWSSIWQQRPAPEGGGRFKKESFRYWETYTADQAYYKLTAPAGLGEILVPKSECWRFTTIDLAATTKKRSDWSVVSCWDVVPPRIDARGRTCPSLLLLVDRVRQRVETADHQEMLDVATDVWRPAWHGVEKATYGLQVIQAGIRSGLRVQPLDADNDKWSRSEIAGVMCSNGRLFWPKGASWLGEWEHEHLMFPDGAHDDQVDTTSYAAIEVEKRRQKPRRDRNAPKSLREKVFAKSKGRRLHPVLGRI